MRLAVEQYDWPGNVRELHNFLDRYLAFGDEALLSLGDAGRADLLLNTPRMIRQALEKCRWHRGKAAEELGLNLRTLQRKMRRMSGGSEKLQG